MNPTLKKIDFETLEKTYKELFTKDSLLKRKASIQEQMDAIDTDLAELDK